MRLFRHVHRVRIIIVYHGETFLSDASGMSIESPWRHTKGCRHDHSHGQGDLTRCFHLSLGLRDEAATKTGGSDARALERGGEVLCDVHVGSGPLQVRSKSSGCGPRTHSHIRPAGVPVDRGAGRAHGVATTALRYYDELGSVGPAARGSGRRYALKLAARGPLRAVSRRRVCVAFHWRAEGSGRRPARAAPRSRAAGSRGPCPGSF